MIFVRIAIAFFLIFLFGKIVDFNRSQQEKCESLSVKYVAFGILNTLLLVLIMISMFTIISGTIPTPIFSIFSVFLALFLGIEFANWMLSAKISYRQVLAVSFSLALLLWPTFYGTGYLIDQLDSQNTLLFRIGVIEFSVLGFCSMIMAPTFGIFTERYL